MDTFVSLLSNPFFWGTLIGFFLCGLSIFGHIKTKMELKRLKGHLSDKLEIEAEKMTEMKEQIEKQRGENENLRMKINSGRMQNDYQALERELEIYARAEKTMVVNAPGFAQAWEKAKEAGLTEIEEEESGKSLPRRIFKKFFTKGTTVDGEVIESLPQESSTRGSSEDS